MHISNVLKLFMFHSFYIQVGLRMIQNVHAEMDVSKERKKNHKIDTIILTNINLLHKMLVIIHNLHFENRNTIWLICESKLGSNGVNKNNHLIFHWNFSTKPNEWPAIAFWVLILSLTVKAYVTKNMNLQH